MSRDYRRRYTRGTPTHIRLTDDDLTMIRAIAQHRFLRSTYLVRLLSHRSPRKVVDRLTLLFHAGLLDRPPAQLDQFGVAGSAPLVYALGNRGADVLAAAGFEYSNNVDWTGKNREAKRPYIEHALRTAELMMALQIEARARHDVDFVESRILQASLPLSARSSRNPWSLTARVSTNRSHITVSTIPDAVFALQFNETGRRSYFFVEADRATMPISRSDLTQSSFRRKLMAYLIAHKERQHVERLGFANLRVLTITTSQERIATMLATLSELTGGRGSGIFLFTDMATLAVGDPLTSPWTTTHGPVRLDVSPR